MDVQVGREGLKLMTDQELQHLGPERPQASLSLQSSKQKSFDEDSSWKRS